jgi:hypothetical protein
LAGDEAPRPEEFARTMMAEFDRAESTAWRWVLAAGAAAAIAITLLRPPAPKPAPAADNEPFIAIPYTVPLAPDEHPLIARMQIPVAALIAAGIPVDADPTAKVDADVLVGEDGRVRAVRIRE